MGISRGLRLGLATILLLGAWGTASASVQVLGNGAGNSSPGPTVDYLDIISFSNASAPTPSGTSIDHKWYFTVAQPLYLKDGAVSFNFYDTFQVILSGPGVFWDSGVITTGNKITIPYTLLPTTLGTYFIEVIGHSTNANANYSGIGQLVPLPAAAWLLLSGVAGLGAMARRRKVAAEA